MKTLSNDFLTIRVSPFGAELNSIVANATKKEYIWQADPAYWKRHSPILFPIVGGVWNGEYRHQGDTFQLPQHGFARDKEFSLIEETSNEVRFCLTDDAETRKNYPFFFRLEIAYRLINNEVHILWTVRNTGIVEMHFQIGAHPAFYYPNYNPSTPGRGYFAFDNNKNLIYTALGEKGCVGDEKHPIPLDNEGLLPLDNHTFDIDTFIIEDNQLRRVNLLDMERRPYLSVHFVAPVVGLWSPPEKDAPFVCIEPWYGRCDRVNYTGEYKNRDWVQHVSPGEEFRSSYVIEIQ